MKFIRLNLLLLGLGALTLVLSSQLGCRAGAFAKPDFSKLAFWKKDHMKLGSNELPPPSAHFDPEPTGVAKSKAPVADDLQQRVDRILAGAEKDKQQASADGPIREPYELDDIDPTLEQDEDNSFDPSVASRGNAGALVDLQRSLENLKQSAGDAGHELVDQAKQRVAQSQQAIDGWKSDFELPQAELKASAAQTVEQARQFASDRGNQMIEATQNRLQQATDTATQQWDRAASNLQQQAAQTMGQFQAELNNSFQPPANGGLPTMRAEPVSTNPANSSPFGGSNEERMTAPNSTASMSTHTPLQPIAPKSNATNNYPSTGYPEFQARTTHEASPIRTAELPNQFGASPAGASMKTGNATEHRIPSTLLEGTSTFAPGSVKRLKPIDGNWQAPK